MLLNSTQARKIFDKYSFLWGTQDVMIAAKAGDLFGDDAVIFAIRAGADGPQTTISLDAGDGHSQVFLTYNGLKQAISYSNQQEIINRNKMIYGNKPPSVKDEEWHEVKENSKVISFEERRRRA